MQNQTGFITRIVLLLLTVCAVVVLIGRHISAVKMEASLHKAEATATAATTTVVNRAKVSSDKCTANTAGKLVLVSITQQHLWACQGETLAKQSAVTTGAPDMPRGINDSTPVGTWHIYEKFRNLDLKGSDVNGPWDDYVQYWMPFDSAVGFHDASWQTFPFGGSQYKTLGSHGCVQLPTNTAAWLYGWAPVGTRVVVQA